MVSKIIRVRREDSAFCYAIFESLEGLLSFSTLPHQNHEGFRDLSLSIVEGQIEDWNSILAGLRKKFPVLEL